MNQMLRLGQTVQSKSADIQLTVKSFIGGGGQGEVYAAQVGDEPVALKWFFPHYLRQDKRLRERLERAIQTGAPSDRFLWPTELVSMPGIKGFGYLMPLREARFRGMVDLVTRRVEPSFFALATAGFELANSFLQLHAKGLCYRDISFGNVFFDPATGEVRICDNDNVDIDGKPGTIGGTARFMAPEIVRGEAMPTAQTDLFSLAVLMFYLLVNHHPLEGAKEANIRCFDLPAMTKLYGESPVFIFDPDDTSNRPLPGLHDNAEAFWPVYPTFLRDLFTRAFTTGLHDPDHGRVRESEWRAALIRLRDSLFYCVHCGAENFYDADALRAQAQSNHAGPTVCWSCSQQLHLAPRMRIARGGAANVALLNHDTKLYGHHFDAAAAYDFSTPWAEIAIHPQQPSIWGLRNLSPEKWVATKPDGEITDVETGRSVTLATGLRLQIGASEVEIRL
jgi:eukaryotic-like serine/threonine-protein kinase